MNTYVLYTQNTGVICNVLQMLDTRKCLGPKNKEMDLKTIKWILFSLSLNKFTWIEYIYIYIHKMFLYKHVRSPKISCLILLLFVRKLPKLLFGWIPQTLRWTLYIYKINKIKLPSWNKTVKKNSTSCTSESKQLLSISMNTGKTKRLNTSVN